MNSNNKTVGSNMRFVIKCIVTIVVLQQTGNASADSTSKDYLNRTAEEYFNDTITEIYENCKCVIFYQCDEKNNIITSGEGLIDMRMGSKNMQIDQNELKEQTQRIPCSMSGYFCCKTNQTIENTTDPILSKKIPIIDITNDLTNKTAYELINDTITELLEDCKCVNFYQCDAKNNIITNGEGLIDMRDGTEAEETQRIPCSQPGYFCCKYNSNETTGNSTEEESSTIGQENQSTETSLITNNTSHKTTTYKSMNSDNWQSKCGVQKAQIDVRILNSEDVQSAIIGEVPWIVAIFRNTTPDSQGEFKCSGSLIHPKVILTATHCVRNSDASDLKVVTNCVFYNNSKHKLTGKENIRRVSEIIKHPEYYSGGLYNDIALLILEKPYEFETLMTVNPVCLPDTNSTFLGKTCFVAGWPQEKEKERSSLKKIDLSLVEFNECQRNLQRTRLGSEFELHSSFLCAGGEEGKDACKGDGGGPLVCPSDELNGRYVQVGLVSWGVECGKAGVPGVYTDIARFEPWIQNELKQKSITL